LDLCNYTLPVDETNAEAYEFVDSLVYMGAPGDYSTEVAIQQTHVVVFY
jgi:hypothetical protein